jgi:hypothetical protein
MNPDPDWVLDPTNDEAADNFISGYLTGYLISRGLDREQAAAEIALGAQSTYDRVQTVAASPSDAARWASISRFEHGEAG